jgi:hypothetical protein
MYFASLGRMLRPYVLLATASLFLLARAPTPVSACGGPGCFPDQFVPVTGSLPQNAQAIAVFLGRAIVVSDARAPLDAGPSFDWVDTTKSDLSFECTDAMGSTTAIPFELEQNGLALLRPQRPLAVGDTCSIVGHMCGERGPVPLAGREYLQGHAEFRVIKPAALPSTLGTLELNVAQRDKVELAGGAACGESYESCVVRASVVLSKEATPWKDALIYSTWVDGQGWSVGDQEIGVPSQEGGSYLGRGRDLFYYLLEDARPGAEGLTRGKHRVSIRATLPGTDLMIETPPKEMTLDCGAPGSSSSCAVGNVRSSSPNSIGWMALLVLVAARKRNA